ncbi:MAG: hypothetical protein EOM14_02525 [Clostridia bacterium]|nr:hypothetical protein [Clostridia bacterium]
MFRIGGRWSMDFGKTIRPNLIDFLFHPGLKFRFTGFLIDLLRFERENRSNCLLTICRNLVMIIASVTVNGRKIERDACEHVFQLSLIFGGQAFTTGSGFKTEPL